MMNHAGELGLIIGAGLGIVFMCAYILSDIFSERTTRIRFTRNFLTFILAGTLLFIVTESDIKIPTHVTSYPNLNSVIKFFTIFALILGIPFGLPLGLLYLWNKYDDVGESPRKLKGHDDGGQSDGALGFAFIILIIVLGGIGCILGSILQWLFYKP
jgi:hypothetical protein